jgi:hypothetical protein
MLCSVTTDSTFQITLETTLKCQSNYVAANSTEGILWRSEIDVYMVISTNILARKKYSPNAFKNYFPTDDISLWMT